MVKRTLILAALIGIPTAGIATARTTSPVPILQDGGTVTVDHRYQDRVGPYRTTIDGVAGDVVCVRYTWPEPKGTKIVLLCQTVPS